MRRRAAAAIAAALLAMAPARATDGSAELVVLINDFRAESRRCGAERMPLAGPLAPDPALSSVAVGAGNDLGGALVRAGYRAVAATALVVSGPRDARATMALIVERHCRDLMDSRFAHVGVDRTGATWRIRLARPLVPPDLVDWHVAGETILRRSNEARAAPRACGERRFAAAPPLRWSDRLAAAALSHSRDMAEGDYVGHQDRAGRSAADRIGRAGYPWRAIGENVAAGIGSPEQAVDGWLASPGHCANLMSPDFTEMGAAYATRPASELVIYWTQVFGHAR